MEQLESRRLLTSVTFSQHEITSEDDLAPVAAVVADLDTDGDLDVLSAYVLDGRITWHKNEDGRGSFGEPIFIDQDFAHAQEVHAMDIDEDGDLDIIATFHGEWYSDSNGNDVVIPDSMRWYENKDGKGDFSEGKSLVDLDSRGVLELQISDVDGDGANDIIRFEYERITWYRNLAGTGFSEERTISTDTHYFRYDAVDFNGDRDHDVLSVREERATPDTMMLHENQGDIFATRDLFVAPPDRSLQSMLAADIDGDGDADVLSASVDRSSVTSCTGFECNPRNLKLSWRENLEGTGTMGEEQILFAAAFPVGQIYGDYDNDLSAVDVDNDGDLDVVMISTMDLLIDPGGSVDEVVWFENVDGAGSFAAHQTITTATNGIRSLAAADIDSDGDIDFLSASRYDGKIAWYESDLIDRDQRIPGDADENGDVAFADFLLLSANYGKQVDAVWAEGDFNEDGSVSFEDFLILSANFSRVGKFAAT